MNKDVAYSPYYTEGAKYQEVKNLTVKEIAKLIRSEIGNTFPSSCGWKIFVRIEDHRKINVGVKSSPVALYNSEWAKLNIEAEESGNWDKFREATWGNHNRIKQHSAEGDAVFLKLKGIVEQYNFDDNDVMTDYFHVNYYTSVGVDSDYSDKLVRESIKDYVY